MAPSSTKDQEQKITEVIAKAGLVYSEKSTLSEILSKPKIMPLKSITLQKIEEMEKEALERAIKMKKNVEDPFSEPQH
ncbi:hypothetical protein C9374_004411 [Naegleria lovaniensis]|uniref:Uncharacterized protein n=1 Tax=Naegleria lovaniensis TaxID=51637 RepID=A0AA88KIQ2_NAELO|nr:uncharacterized protein C9374_004411 [Naegleria lovaniensis]KAG2383074.1 hypothetical protein C9374_004411 [Naegleria lovaniensis]